MSETEQEWYMPSSLHGFKLTSSSINDCRPLNRLKRIQCLDIINQTSFHNQDTLFDQIIFKFARSHSQQGRVPDDDDLIIVISSSRRRGKVVRFLLEARDVGRVLDLDLTEFDDGLDAVESECEPVVLNVVVALVEFGGIEPVQIRT